MSGGSYNYVYHHVEDFANSLLQDVRLSDGEKIKYSSSLEEQTSRYYREMFANHLLKIAGAMKAIEWVDSYDSSYPSDVIEIIEALQPIIKYNEIHQILNGSVVDDFSKVTIDLKDRDIDTTKLDQLYNKISAIEAAMAYSGNHLTDTPNQSSD